MEKHTPHHKLQVIQAKVALIGMDAFTRVAVDGKREMGLSDEQALAVIACLTRKNFRKSMTTFADHRVWQDVYNSATPCGDAYIKFTLRDDGAIVISFKRL